MLCFRQFVFTIDLLRLSFLALKRDAAAGVDGVKWEDYEFDLEQRLTDLHARIHRGGWILAAKESPL